MTENDGTPEVVILGMPSSGKTVFLSVLGSKYALSADGGNVAPLGFRMIAKDKETLGLMNREYEQLSRGGWPRATVRGAVTELRWEVCTGKRKIFDLSTSDWSGEDIKDAFLNRESKSEGNEGNSDALLKTDAGEPSQRESRVDELREKVDRAKLVCLFINVSALREGSDQDPKKYQGLKDAADCYWDLLNSHPEIASKCLLVLTQTHLAREEIRNAGGPFLYLEKSMPHLQQQIERRKVPIICVSAVNETSSENAVPEKIESDGLFGFLLTVGGIVAGKKDPLGKLKCLYHDYLRSRDQVARHLWLCSPLPERLFHLRLFSQAASDFRKGCLDYLKDTENLKEEFPGSKYRAVTRVEGDIREAENLWKDRLRIDEVWNEKLCAYGRVNLVRPDEEEDEVESKIRDRDVMDLIASVVEAFPESGEDAVFGFNEGIDLQRSPYEDRVAWVRAGMAMTSVMLANKVGELRNRVGELEESLGSVESAVGKVLFPEAVADFQRIASKVDGGLRNSRDFAVRPRIGIWFRSR